MVQYNPYNIVVSSYKSTNKEFINATNTLYIYNKKTL